MYSICIDASDRYKKTIKLLHEDLLIDEFNGDLDILSAIRDILSKNQLKPSNIDHFYINKGPGSFTGLKVSAAIANAFNWSLGNANISDLIIPTYEK